MPKGGPWPSSADPLAGRLIDAARNKQAVDLSVTLAPDMPASWPGAGRAITGKRYLKVPLFFAPNLGTLPRNAPAGRPHGHAPGAAVLRPAAGGLRQCRLRARGARLAGRIRAETWSARHERRHGRKSAPRSDVRRGPGDRRQASRRHHGAELLAALAGDHGGRHPEVRNRARPAQAGRNRDLSLGLQRRVLQAAAARAGLHGRAAGGQARRLAGTGPRRRSTTWPARASAASAPTGPRWAAPNPKRPCGPIGPWAPRAWSASSSSRTSTSCRRERTSCSRRSKCAAATAVPAGHWPSIDARACEGPRIAAIA